MAVLGIGNLGRVMKLKKAREVPIFLLAVPAGIDIIQFTTRCEWLRAYSGWLNRPRQSKFRAPR